MEKNINIVFFGTPEFSIPALRYLLKANYKIGAVVTSPDEVWGRKKELNQSAVKIFSLEHGLVILQPASLKEDATFNEFQKLNPDLCVVVAYGRIIPERYLNIPKYGFLNIHPSLLPKYRGPTPIQTAISNGNTETGVTIMLLDKDVDHGPIVSSNNYNLKTTSSYPEAAGDLAIQGAKLLIETLPRYLSGEIKPQEQNHSEATFTKIFSRGDAKINWHNTAEKIYNQVRALNPEPGTWTTWDIKTLKIKEAEVVFDGQETHSPGKVSGSDGDIFVETSRGLLKIKKLQLEGKKELSAKEFINGFPTFVGSTLI